MRAKMKQIGQVRASDGSLLTDVSNFAASISYISHYADADEIAEHWQEFLGLIEEVELEHFSEHLRGKSI